MRLETSVRVGLYKLDGGRFFYEHFIQTDDTPDGEMRFRIPSHAASGLPEIRIYDSRFNRQLAVSDKFMITGYRRNSVQCQDIHRTD